MEDKYFNILSCFYVIMWKTRKLDANTDDDKRQQAPHSYGHPGA